MRQPAQRWHTGRSARCRADGGPLRGGRAADRGDAGLGQLAVSWNAAVASSRALRAAPRAGPPGRARRTMRRSVHEYPRYRASLRAGPPVRGARSPAQARPALDRLLSQISRASTSTRTGSSAWRCFPSLRALGDDGRREGLRPLLPFDALYARAPGRRLRIDRRGFGVLARALELVGDAERHFDVALGDRARDACATLAGPRRAAARDGAPRARQAGGPTPIRRVGAEEFDAAPKGLADRLLSRTPSLSARTTNRVRWRRRTPTRPLWHE